MTGASPEFEIKVGGGSAFREDESRDLVFTSINDIQAFLDNLYLAGYLPLAELLEPAIDQVTVSEEDSQTFRPPIRILSGMDFIDKTNAF